MMMAVRTEWRYIRFACFSTSILSPPAAPAFDRRLLCVCHHSDTTVVLIQARLKCGKLHLQSPLQSDEVNSNSRLRNRHSPHPTTAYSASICAMGPTSPTCIPPLFLSSLSWNGRLHPPSCSGVASHNRIKCRLGNGGAWSLYAVLACRTCAFDKNCMSPTSRIICKDNLWQVASSTSAA